MKTTTIKKVLKSLNLMVKYYKMYKTAVKKIWLCLILITICTACGTTKVSVQKPAEGTSTTITVTTNNPITTTPNTNISDLWK